MSSKASSDRTPPYGVNNLWRPVDVQVTLDVSKDTLRRSLHLLHVLTLRNGARLSPKEYILGLASLLDIEEAARFSELATDYATTNLAQDQIRTSEEGFEASLDAALTHRRTISATAIAGLLGYSKQTVTTWMRRPDIFSLATGLQEESNPFFVSEVTFRNFYRWQRPQFDPKHLTA